MARRILTLLILVLVAVALALMVWYLGSQKQPSQVSYVIGLIAAFV